MAELEGLHRALLVDLLGRLKGPGRAGIEQLAVARAFLKDNQQCGRWDMPPATQRKLEKLYSDLCRHYVKAMAEERPTAAMLGEVRSFLTANNVTKDFTAAVDRATAGAVVDFMAGLDMPFRVQ